MAAFHADDADGFVALMAENIFIEHGVAPAPMHARAEVSAFYTNFWKGFPDLTLEPMDGPFFHLRTPRISLNSFAAGWNEN